MPDVALAYVRVSTLQQETGGRNLEQQLGEIKAYCAKKGYVLRDGDVYKDILSGAKSDRLGYYELLQRVERGDAQVVVAYEVSRFGRNSLDNAWLMVKAQEYGLRIETVTGGRDFASDPEGELLFDVLTAVAKFERRSILLRMQRGRRTAHDRGYVSGNVPFGYKAVGKNGRKELVPSEWAPLVREIFKRHQDGWTVARLVKWLRTLDTPRKWEKMGVKYLLRNPVYRGWLTYKGKLVKGTHPPLTDT